MTRLVSPLSRPRSLALLAAAFLLALSMWGCGGASDDSGDDGAASPEVTVSGESGGVSASGYIEPDYSGLPTDLTPEEVCDLLDEATVAEHLDAEVNQVKPGTSQPDCHWYYKLPGGPATTLQVQVMSMGQTGDLVGTKALEWGLDRAPAEVEISEVAALDVPNGSYEFYASTVIFAIDPAGRLFTVSAHSETSEEGRVALTEAVLASLTERHS